MSKKFGKNAQKFVVVHRPHDDPHYYDADATEHMLVPVSNPNKPEAQHKRPVRKVTRRSVNEHVGEAKLYGIEFDDTKYDYTQHLKPIGVDPEAVFVPAKKEVVKEKKKNIEDLFVDQVYKEEEGKPESVFQRGMAKPEYLKHQQLVPDDIKGFKPDMNPALREVLEALEDEEYVVNEDIVVTTKKASKSKKDISASPEDDDDIFAELLQGGEVASEGEFEDEFDEWDVDNLDTYEDSHYHEEMKQFDNIENLEDLEGIDYQADVMRYQKELKNKDNDYDSDNEFEKDGLSDSEVFEDEEEGDVVGELPTINSKNVGKKKRKERKKKGAMSDISGFSMTSSAIARTETMTILDDKYDNIISSYENYEDELEEDEYENAEPFNMENERADFESMLDDFLDNYELDAGGRKIVKKDEERDRIKQAADEVSKGKLSQKRNRERQKQKSNMENVTNSLSSLRF
ncbi:Protein LTV1 [Nakaseomyces bracarensis]|uniref:Protein LTV1 n=1 Tax=Nakaseomyces bracarensis TaxID=273131 RepID=A0ABR4P0Q0_9SACH